MTTAIAGKKKWTNWAGNQSCRPRSEVRPVSRGELVDTVAGATAEGRRIRVPGSGHSFTGAALTDDLMVDISALSGVIDADLSSGLVKVGAGTVLADLNRELDRLGRALINLGDIDRQTVAGAISTGTHGTGEAMPNLPEQVAAIDLVSADGTVHTFSEEDGLDRLRAARVAVGSLGVISAVTVKTVPAFNLHRTDLPMPLDQVLADFDELAAANDHFEFFIFPYTDQALTLSRNRTEAPVEPRGTVERFISDRVIENGIGDVLLRGVGRFPDAIPKLAQFSARFMTQAEQTDTGHRVFVNYRTIRFKEMEYCLPREQGLTALTEVLELIRREEMPLAMPIECRVLAADRAILSPSYERPSIYLAVHQHRGSPSEPYFEQIEEVFRSHEGRPHWGKLHTQDATSLAGLYPEWDSFQEIRDELDPERTFTNAYVARVLGP